jgi:succinoglycan biosynthesis protein ExoA
MKVSVIVVTFNEEKNIKQCIDSFCGMQYKDDFEVIIADGGSSDKTEELVKELIKEIAKKNKGTKIRFLTEKGKTGKGSITECRNAGAKAAKYEYIAYTDADCIVPQNWLTNMVAGFQRIQKITEAKQQKLAGVGGANIPPENPPAFQKAIGVAFNSLLGSLGSIQARPPKEDKQVFSISCCNSLFKKSALKTVNLFSEELGNQGEDWDMGAKLNKAGFVCYGIRDSFVWHNFRATPKAFWKNMLFYGDGRMRLMKKHKDLIKKRYLLPLAFIPLFVVSLGTFVATRNPVTLIPFAYFPLILLYSIAIAIKQNQTHLSFHVFYAFLVQHFGYAWGEMKGLRWFVK